MRLLITGASGQLGGYVLRELQNSKTDVAAWSHARGGRLFGHQLQPLDLANADQTAIAFRQAQPTAILHLAAFSSIAGCIGDPIMAQRVNALGTTLLAELAAVARARLVFVSTDLVFDGARGQYSETDMPNPLSVYARTKLGGETAVLETPRGVVARLSLLFGPSVIGRPYFLDAQCEKMRAGQETTWFADEWRSPLALMVAARALLNLVEEDFTGLIHLGGPERLSRHEMGLRLAAYMGTDPAKVIAVPQASVPAPEPRPRDTSLDCGKWRSLFPAQWWPGWEEALEALR